jgi:hypothetical protein
MLNPEPKQLAGYSVGARILRWEKSGVVGAVEEVSFDIDKASDELRSPRGLVEGSASLTPRIRISSERKRAISDWRVRSPTGTRDSGNETLIRGEIR